MGILWSRDRQRDLELVNNVAIPAAPARSLVASAIKVNFEDISYNTYRFRDETWQRELWRLYDLVPEFAYSARWVGNCCSQVRIYVADVDKLGRVQKETTKPKIAALSDAVLGGPSSKAESLRALGINLTVAGEAYVVGKPRQDDVDEWFILSSTEIRRARQNRQWGDKMYPEVFNQGPGVVTRVWTPHPQRVWCADSPARSCQPVLRELEQLTKYIFSQIDSRLVSAGLLIIPNNLDLPDDGSNNSAGESLMIRLATAGAQSLRGEGTALGVLPHIIEAAPEDIERGFKLVDFSSELSKQALELRTEAVRRLGLGMDMPPEVLEGQGSQNHWCVPTDTEALTKDRGWVTHDQLVEGDLIRTLNDETGLSEWSPVLDIYRADVVDEPMYSLKGKFYDSLSTANHRWPVIRNNEIAWTVSESLRYNDKIIRSAPAADLPTVAKYDDDFVELVAWFITEGTCTWPSSTRCQVRIGQSHKANPLMVARIRATLTRLFGPGATENMRRLDGPAWRETPEPRGMTLFNLNKAAYGPMLDMMESWHSKVASRDFILSLTLSQLNLFLEVCALGDGTIYDKGSVVIDQRDPRRLDPIELAGVLAGRPVSRVVRETGGFGRADQTFQTVGATCRSIIRVGKKNVPATYTGTIWCPRTTTGTWLARRNGKAYYTGNSGYLTEGIGIKVHIEPLMIRICDALNKSYLKPALKILGEDASRYTFAFDTSPLSVRPQRLTDALNLYEKGELNGEALRQAGYFKESDAPTDEDRARTFVKELLLRDPQLIQNQAVRELAGITEEMLPQTAMIMPTPGGPMGSGGGGIGGSGPPPPPPPPTGIQSELPPPMPDTAGMSEPPPGPPTGIQAAASGDGSLAVMSGHDMALVILAEATVRRALELAGKRLLDKRNRDKWPDTPSFELHTRIPVSDSAHAFRLLNGAWEQLPAMVDMLESEVDPEKLRRSLARYCSIILVQGAPHEPRNLLNLMQAEELVCSG